MWVMTRSKAGGILLDLDEVKTKFGLQQVEDELFFSEWQESLSELADSDK